MKIGRQYIGKTVEVRWSDPSYGKVDLHMLKRGRAALATWREYGIVHDITEGVVVLIHSYGTDETVPQDGKQDEVCFTSLQEDVIDAITVLLPEKLD